MFRNIAIASVVAAVLVGGAAQPAAAQTIGDLQTQIQSLLTRIAELSAQLNILRGQQHDGGTTASTPAMPALMHRLCAMQFRSFAEGAEGDDVRAFQEFLQSEGYFNGTPTGYFGSLTKGALIRWQIAQGFEGVGSWGPKSSERFRAKCGLGSDGSGSSAVRFTASPAKGSASLTVTFNTWLSGFRLQSVYYTIDFGDGASERAADCPAPADACTGPGQNTHTYSTNGTYTAILKKITTNGCVGTSEVSCAAWESREEIVGKVQITVGSQPQACTKEYAPVCGSKPIVCITTPCNPVPTTYSNRCMMNNDGASFLYEGQCRSTTTNPADDPQCKSWYDGCNTCSRSTSIGAAACTLRACFRQEVAYCTAYFDNSNRPPTVSGLSGPTTLAVNQTGTWTVTASDPENGPLSYSVDWGETKLYQGYGAAAPTGRFQQTTTLSHAYAWAGTYTVSITVTDNAGLTATAATTVKVGDATAICTMEYAPVCGRPPGCANTCAPGMVCPAICQLREPQNYSNRCVLGGAGAQFLHDGNCTATSGSIY